VHGGGQDRVFGALKGGYFKGGLQVIAFFFSTPSSLADWMKRRRRQRRCRREGEEKERKSGKRVVHATHFHTLQHCDTE